MKTEGYVGIFDPDEFYRGCLLKGLMEKETGTIQFVEFTKLESIISFVKTKRLSMLIINEMAVNTPVMEADIGRLIYLTEEKTEETNDEEGCIRIFKYQPVKEISRRIQKQYELLVYGGEGAPKAYRQKDSCLILGVYSPVKRCLKTSFALAAARIMGESKRTLLLCFEEYSAIMKMMDLSGEGQSGLADAMYQYRQGGLSGLDASIIRSSHGFDFIPPVKNPEDLREMTDEVFFGFVNYFAQIYDCIILDYGDCMSGLVRRLKLCSKVFMPLRSDWISEEKADAFRRYIGREFPGIAALIDEVSPPYQHVGSGPGKKGAGNFSRLVSGEFYDYVRSRLRM